MTRRELSPKPSQIRRRLRRQGEASDRDYEMLVEVGGIKPIEDWDLEELSRGRPRDKKGGWRGGAVRGWLTARLRKEIAKRLRDRTLEAMAEHVPDAVAVIAKLMKADVDDTTRLRAATLVIEHAVGKPQAHLQIDAQIELKDFLATALVLDDGSDAHPVVDGQFYETDDDEDDDLPVAPVEKEQAKRKNGR